MQNKIKIPLSKTKILLLTIACLAFVICSLWMFNFEEEIRGFSVGFLKTVGLIGFALFGVLGIFGFKKLFDTKPGLEINNQGIIENTNAISVGLIEWKDILGFEVYKFGSQKLIAVKVKKPKKYIDKATNNAQKRVLRLNEQQYGSPVHITNNSLKIGFDELVELLNGELKKRKK